MRRGLIGFTLLVLLGALEPFSLQGQELQQPPPAGLQTATFAGGCFWCMVHPFEVIDGVIRPERRRRQRPSAAPPSRAG